MNRVRPAWLRDGLRSGLPRAGRMLAALLLTSLAALASCPAAQIDPAWDAPDPPPYSPGERLFYRVEWNPPWYFFFLPAMEAGRLELGLEESPLPDGKPAWRITFKATSSGTLARLTGMRIEDVFESHADPESLCTFSVSKRIREGRRRRTIEVRYEPEQERLHILELDTAVTPPRTVKNRFKYDVPFCVHDVFAALYALRRTPLGLGASRRWILGDDDQIKEVETRVLRSETVAGPAGPVKSLRVETIALLGGLFKEGGEFRIWLSDDRRRLPLQFEIQVKLGRVFGRLVSIQP